MGKGPVQAPFSTCLHSSCSRCVHERPDDRQLESSTTFTKDFNQVKALSRSFASGGPENKLESEIRAEETHRSGQTRKDSLGKTDMTHGPQSSTSPLPDMAREELYMPQKPGSVRFGAYRELLSTRFLSRDHKLQRTSAEIDTFVKEDLNLDRLNNIHGWLWLVGRLEAARPLHGQLMRKRTIIVTEQMDLHLTWNDSSLYIKPLPAYLLCTKFWKDYLCEDPVLHERACGFLLSYSWLICYNSDFLIATKGDKAPYLIPSIITWSTGQSFIEEFLDALDSEHAKIKVNRRYEFGELRLARLNQICRFAPLWWYLLAGKKRVI
jgi:hypothetical protein